jgi:hypothetical protein
MKRRDLHQLSIIRRETFGRTRSIPSKKAYSRKCKHKKRQYKV